MRLFEVMFTVRSIAGTSLDLTLIVDIFSLWGRRLWKLAQIFESLRRAKKQELKAAGSISKLPLQGSNRLKRDEIITAEVWLKQCSVSGKTFFLSFICFTCYICLPLQHYNNQSKLCTFRCLEVVPAWTTWAINDLWTLQWLDPSLQVCILTEQGCV